MKQSGSFAVFPALQQRKKKINKTPHAAFTFTKYYDEKSGIFFMWPKAALLSLTKWGMQLKCELNNCSLLHFQQN